MSVGVVTCKFIKDMKKENDERVSETETEKRQRKGGRERTVNRISLFKTGYAGNHLPSCPSCVSFRPLITVIMES